MLQSNKCLLVHQGGMENYGLIYVAGELKRLGCTVKWIDGESEPFPMEELLRFKPDFTFFSPMTHSFRKSVELCLIIKNALPNVITVFGGHHVSSVPEDSQIDIIDYTVIGPVYGTLENILSGKSPKLVQGHQGGGAEISPSREEYYEDIERLKIQPVRIIMSHYGCQFNCSYCAASRVRSSCEHEEYKNKYLKRRPAIDLINEAQFFLKDPPREVFLADDDCLQGDDAEEWLEEFALLWKEKIGLPITTYITPFSLSKASDSLMKIVASLFPFVNMGVQTLSEKTLQFFNRSFQTEDMIRKALGRLRDFGIRARLELIFGAPVDDPVEEALYSLTRMQEVAPDFYCAAYALLVFPGTALYNKFQEEKIPFSDPKSPFIHSGYTSVLYDKVTMEKIRKLTKLSHIFVSNKIDIRYMRALLELDMNNNSAFEISKANFFMSQRYKYGEEGERLAEERMKNMEFYF